MMHPTKFWLLTVVGAAVVSAVPSVGGWLALIVLAGAFAMRRRSGNRLAASGQLKALPSVQGTEVAVVGTSHYDGIDDVDDGDVVPAELRREHGNRFDLNAVGVWTGNPPQMTGYIPGELAVLVGPRMDASRTHTLRTIARFRDYSLMVLIPAPLNEGLGRKAMGASDPKLWTAVLSPWGRATEQLEIDDEYRFRGQVASVFALSGVELDNDGAELNLEGRIASSASDPNIIFLLVEGLTIGRLSDRDAKRYREQVAAADAAESHIPVSVRLWARDDDGIVRSRASISVPPPNLIQPPWPLPAVAHIVLPHGSKVQVTGEDAHLNELAAILAGRPEVPAVATLHELQPLGRAAKTRVEVRIDDQGVGTLSPAMSEHFLPTVRVAAEQGLVVACRASVVGNALKADVVLDVAKCGDLTREWIDAHVYGRTPDGSKSSRF